MTCTGVWIADPSDASWPDEPTTRLVDLNEAQSASDTGFFTTSISLPGDNQESVSFGQMGEDGDEQADSRHASDQAVMVLGYKGESLDGMGDAISALEDAMDQKHGVFAIHIEGKDSPVYYDFNRSQLPSLLTGQAMPFDEIARRLLAKNLVVTFNLRHPHGRLAPVTLDPVVISNDVLDRHYLIENPGNRPSEIQLRYAPEAGSVAALFQSLRTHGNFTEMMTLYSQALSGADFPSGSDTSSEASTGASGGNAARTAFADTTFDKRLRLTITATDPTAIEGTWIPRLRMKPTGGASTEKEFKALLYYSFSAGDPLAANRCERKRHRLDFSDLDTPDWVEVDMGFIVVPKGVTTLVIDLYAEQLSGTDWDMDWDQIILQPADYWYSPLSTVGHRMGSWGKRRYPADELSGTGALVRGSYRLNDTDEIAYAGPAVGLLLPAGTYEARTDVSIRNESEDKRKVGILEVRKNPSGADTSKGSVRLTSTKKLWRRRRRGILFAVSGAEETAGDRFRPQDKFTDSDADGRRIGVHAITLRFLRAITSSLVAVVDSRLWNRDAYAEESAVPAFPLNNENWLPRVPGGNSVLVIGSEDLPAVEGYDVVDDEDAPVGISTLAREVTVTAIITPRVGNPLGG